MTTLKQYRQYAGISTKTAADHMQVSVRTIYTWEDGSRPISAVNMLKLLMLYKADATFSQLPELIPVIQRELVLVPERGDQPT